MNKQTPSLSWGLAAWQTWAQCWIDPGPALNTRNVSGCSYSPSSACHLQVQEKLHGAGALAASSNICDSQSNRKPSCRMAWQL